MRIINITSLPLIQNNFANTNINRSAEDRTNQRNNNLPAYGSKIAFGSMYGIKPKKVNIELEKFKLIKSMEEILSADNSETDFADIITNALRSALTSFRSSMKRQEKIIKQLCELEENNTLNPQQKFNELNRLQKEYNRIEKNNLPKQKNKQSKPQDEKLDYQLINRFKSAVSEDDFDLLKIFKEYYGGLKNIKNLDELKEHYPKIQIPKNPAEVIAQKIESTLTRDFYEELDEYIDMMSEEKTNNLFRRTLKSIGEEISKKFGIDETLFAKKTFAETSDLIAKKYITMKTETGFSSVPQQRKVKFPQINETDIKLLQTDFDDFVLTVLKKQHLDSKKLNDIVYSDGKITILLNSLKNSDYKFEKIPEKIKKIISTSDSLLRAQRDYDNFNKNELKARLNSLAGKELGNNEELLENIIAFDNCNFSNEDVQNLIKFLRELDDVTDGKKSVEKGLEIIRKEKLYPKEPENQAQEEIQKNIDNFKSEQKKAFQLNELKNKFDDALNLLYMNNLNNIANTCSKYRPHNLAEDSVENANFIADIVSKNIKNSNDNTINKSGLESAILRWDTFNHYKNNEPDNPLFIKAVQFSQNAVNEVDINKAGQYIINSEIIENYPQSLEFVKYPELIKKIMDKTDYDKEAAVKYLCEFDKYQDMPAADKTYISKILDIFDSKDMVDKVILRHIIENDYINTDTKVLTNIHDTSDETITATFSAKAKQQILNRYKYPVCLDYLKNFEDALSSFATDKGSSGIKRTNRNNKTIEHKIELKIMGYQERLFSSKNDYYFDIFSDKGLH